MTVWRDFRDDKKLRKEKWRENFLIGVWLGEGEEKNVMNPYIFSLTPPKCSPQNGEMLLREPRSHRLRLVRVKVFSENISFSRNAIFRKGKCIQVFGCVGICFTENQFQCLVRTNILRKMTSVLRKIISGVCFRQTFYEKWKSFLMFGLWIILQKITISSTCIT